MNEEFIREIDAALAPAGYADRAKFIRDAVWHRLNQLGYAMPRAITLAPGRRLAPARRKKTIS